ncbi:MAG: class I SAM-dependent methyltransferase [Gammaproteobacteria bacterium]|nr:class I SAM-dependent methyltransferase [Gammaproteobacteria bacterium]
MANPDQEKWDQRYLENNAQPKACSVLEENLHLLPKTGKALDLACGLGGNAILLAKQGLETEAWDISPVAIEKLNERAKGLSLSTKVVDITPDLLPAHHFDAIVVSYFLERGLALAIINSLKPNGLLFYQTFNLNTSGHRPSNPAYRLAKNELLHLFGQLRIYYYSELNIEGTTMLVAQN